MAEEVRVLTDCGRSGDHGDHLARRLGDQWNHH